MIQTPTNTERKADEAAFKSSSKTKRSPTNSTKTVTAIDENPNDTPQAKIVESISTAGNTDLTYSSPRQEFILKMRYSEEEALGKCQKVLRRIRQAMNKQRNISMDVQNGISELEELIDVVGSYRRNWKTAEKDRERSIEAGNVSNKRRTEEVDATPTSSQNKRGASSPPETNPEKKLKGKNKDGKENIPPTRSKRNDKTPRNPNRDKTQRKPKKRSDAVIIKPQDGHSYADVLKSLRQNIKPEETEVAVRSIRKTKTGAILLVMGQGGNKDEFCKSIKGTLKEAAVVQDLKPKATIEIQDLDSLTTPDEVVTAITKAIETPVGDIVANLTGPNKREQVRAFVSLPAVAANELLKTERIKIGMTICRIKYREELKRCFRCFGVGHMQWQCEGPDRKGMGLCIRCGGKGHKMKECRNALKCCICSEEGNPLTDHLPGSRSCKQKPK